jgi:hypothetical protein
MNVRDIHRTCGDASACRDAIKEAIQRIRQNRKDLENTPMKDIIEASTGKTVVPCDDFHKELVREIVRIGDKMKQKFAVTLITSQFFQQIRTNEVNAFRNNEVGDYCEFLIKDIYSTDKSLFKHIKDVKHLRGKGYPDLKIVTARQAVFLEVKAILRPYMGSERDFYYSIGSASDKKIDSDGLHILIGFLTKQVSNGFNIRGFKIVEVSRIIVWLKSEFNADNLGLYDSRNIIYDT